MFEPQVDRSQDEDAVQRVVRAGSHGAVVLAAIATTVVFAIWLAFYFFVFLPRAAP
jgi:hypothetical protein